MPHSHLLDVVTATKKAVRKNQIIECDRYLASQKFVEYSSITSKLMGVKLWQELIPLQPFATSHYYVANLLNSFSNMGFELMLQDLMQTCKSFLDKVKQMDKTKEEVEIPNIMSDLAKKRYEHKTKMIKKTKDGKTVKSAQCKKHLMNK